MVGHVTVVVGGEGAAVTPATTVTRDRTSLFCPAHPSSADPVEKHTFDIVEKGDNLEWSTLSPLSMSLRALVAEALDGGSAFVLGMGEVEGSRSAVEGFHGCGGGAVTAAAAAIAASVAGAPAPRPRFTMSWFQMQATGGDPRNDEAIRDMIAQRTPQAQLHLREVRPGGGLGFVVPGLAEVELSTADDVDSVLRQARGNTSARILAANCHSVITLNVGGTSAADCGRVVFVELARAMADGPGEGDEPPPPLKWWSRLNGVLGALEERHPSPGFKNGRLTLLLRDALACRAPASLVCAVSDHLDHAPRARFFLRFANRIKALAADYRAAAPGAAGAGGRAAAAPVSRPLQAEQLQARHGRSDSEAAAASAARASAETAPPPKRTVGSGMRAASRSALLPEPAPAPAPAARTTTRAPRRAAPPPPQAAMPPPPPRAPAARPAPSPAKSVNPFDDSNSDSESDSDDGRDADALNLYDGAAGAADLHPLPPGDDSSLGLRAALEVSQEEVARLGRQLKKFMRECETLLGERDGLLAQRRESRPGKGGGDGQAREHVKRLKAEVRDYEIYRQVMEKTVGKLQGDAESLKADKGKLEGRLAKREEALRARKFDEHKHRKEQAAAKQRLSDALERGSHGAGHAQQLARLLEAARAEKASMATELANAKGQLAAAKGDAADRVEAAEAEAQALREQLQADACSPAAAANSGTSPARARRCAAARARRGGRPQAPAVAAARADELERRNGALAKELHDVKSQLTMSQVHLFSLRKQLQSAGVDDDLQGTYDAAARSSKVLADLAAAGAAPAAAPPLPSPGRSVAFSRASLGETELLSPGSIHSLGEQSWRSGKINIPDGAYGRPASRVGAAVAERRRPRPKPSPAPSAVHEAASEFLRRYEGARH